MTFEPRSSRLAFLDRVIEAIPRWSYYQLLRIDPSANLARVKEAFHAFALEFHPDGVDEGDECRERSDVIFRRGAEAYRVLGNPVLRARYDQGLREGQLRLTDVASKPRIKPRTLEDIATTAKGKAHARRADQLLSIGDLDDARAPLVSACQEEPGNKELAERLAALWDALAVAPE